MNNNKKKKIQTSGKYKLKNKWKNKLKKTSRKNKWKKQVEKTNGKNK